jgi:hypothetical protein
MRKEALMASWYPEYKAENTYLEILQPKLVFISPYPAYIIPFININIIITITILVNEWHHEASHHVTFSKSFYFLFLI